MKRLARNCGGGHFSNARSGLPNRPKRSTSLDAPGGRIFYLMYAHFGHARHERQSPLCDQSASHPCAKNAQEWATPNWVMQMKTERYSRVGHTPIDLFHCIEHCRTTRAMGNPTQKMCMTTPITNRSKENGYFMALERGTTTRFMKK
jgi:hypothetical protein